MTIIPYINQFYTNPLLYNINFHNIYTKENKTFSDLLYTDSNYLNTIKDVYKRYNSFNSIFYIFSNEKISICNLYLIPDICNYFNSNNIEVTTINDIEYIYRSDFYYDKYDTTENFNQKILSFLDYFINLNLDVILYIEYRLYKEYLEFKQLRDTLQ